MEKDAIAVLREHRGYLAKKFGVSEIAIFGSYARGEQRDDSDVDIMVEFRKGFKTFDNYMDLKFYLEELLGRRVDLIIKSAIRFRIKPFIIEEAVFLK
ncbi:MAG: nucleotidyltransferase family protein [Sulfurihydrogenibium sp.]|nr:nucleotidyltransferase family protein [Sulfurihydrogenibium sp.]